MMTLDWKDISDDAVALQVAFGPNGDLYAVIAVAGKTPPRYAFMAISDKDFRAAKGFESLAQARHMAQKHAERKGKRK